MEELETEVDNQKVSGMMFHLGGMVIWVLIQSPFRGFCRADSMNISSRRFYKDGFNSDYGRKVGKSILRQLYLDHKDYAAIVKAKEEEEKEEQLRTMMTSEDIS
jgi:hypothetical protein